MTETRLPDNAKREQKLQKVSCILKSAQQILILTHKSPDGDTLGSGFALCRALIKLGKNAAVVCSGPIPKRYDYLRAGERSIENPDLIVAVDIATTDLLGETLSVYKERIDLCIDHHGSNGKFAKFTFVDATSAATCEILIEVINKLGVIIDKDIANCLYTGIATDTGCFRYSSTTPKTLKTAAALVEHGAESAALNKLLFETVSKERLELEKLALQSLEYHCGGEVAVMVVSLDMMEKSRAEESETEGIPAIPARIEGVEAGITLREKEDGSYKISVRTVRKLNASQICSKFGGGGHACAAGCRLTDNLETAKRKIVGAVRDALEKEEA